MHTLYPYTHITPHIVHIELYTVPYILFRLCVAIAAENVLPNLLTMKEI